jgi:hypothetical protein
MKARPTLTPMVCVVTEDPDVAATLNAMNQQGMCVVVPCSATALQVMRENFRVTHVVIDERYADAALIEPEVGALSIEVHRAPSATQVLRTVSDICALAPAR